MRRIYLCIYLFFEIKSTDLKDDCSNSGQLCTTQKTVQNELFEQIHQPIRNSREAFCSRFIETI